MGRSGYTDGWGDEWAMIRWRGAVSAAFRGKRGQAFIQEAIEALDALPEKKLAAHTFEKDGCYCLLGAVGLARGDVNLSQLESTDPEEGMVDRELLSRTFGIAKAMAAEMMYVNDEDYWGGAEPQEHRWSRVRSWLVSELKKEKK